MTPAETLYSSQGNEFDFVSDTYPRPLAYRSYTQSSILSGPPTDRHGVGKPSEVDDAKDIIPIEPEEGQSNQPDNMEEITSKSDVHPSIMCKKVATRVEKWRYLRVPEESLVDLTDFLDTLLPAKNPKDAASELLDVLLHDANAAIISILSLSNLLGTSDDQDQFSDFLGEEPVLILLACQSWLDPPDWQVTRALTCISCSPEAARQLAMLAERNSIVPSLSFWRAHDCSCLLEAIKQFELLDVRQSVQAAWSRDIFCVITGANAAEKQHLGWIRCAENASRAHIDKLQSILTGLRDYSNSRPVKLPRSQTGVALAVRQLIDTAKLNGVPGILVKRPSSWSENCPPWCYLMFDQQYDDGFGDPSNFTREKALIYLEGSLSAEDEALLRAWSSQSE